MIYVITDGSGAAKIGTAADPAQRLKQLQTGSSTPLRLVVSGHGDQHLERALHLSFGRWRQLGEWFDLPAEQLEHLVELVKKGVLVQHQASDPPEWWQKEAWATDSVPPDPGVLVGPLEISELLSVAPNTVHQWIARGRLPEPWDVVSGTRLWPRYVIEEWALATGRWDETPSSPDMEEF